TSSVRRRVRPTNEPYRFHRVHTRSMFRVRAPASPAQASGDARRGSPRPPSMTGSMSLEPGSTALLLLDLQRDFLDPTGVYARHGLPVDRLRAIVPAVERITRASRAAHVPIFASKFTIFTSPGGAPLGLDHIVKARPFLLQEGFRLGDAGRELASELSRP